MKPQSSLDPNLIFTLNYYCKISRLPKRCGAQKAEPKAAEAKGAEAKSAEARGAETRGAEPKGLEIRINNLLAN